MDRQYARWHYSSEIIQDTKAGYTGLLLRRKKKNHDEAAAKLIFWDAAGEFFFEMTVSDLPLPILEDLIKEARELIKVK
jgi:hypothetical protein